MATLTVVTACAILLWAFRRLERRNRFQRVLLVGGGALAQEVISALAARPRQRLVGLIEDGSRPLPLRCPCLGSLAEFERIVAEVRPDRVIVALASRRGSMPFKSLLALRLRGVIIQDGVDAYERLTGKVPIESLTPTSVLFGREFRDFQLDLHLARALSVPLAALALILMAPVLFVIAAAIKLESRGPLFFVQERVGRKGRRFKLIKFRTMSPTDKPTSEWERDNHNRLTRVGRFLRRVRLDELPQLLNILKGDMNLVGPRPHPVTNVQLFAMVTRNVPDCGEQIPYYALRSMVRPGLTGWAQVRYHYANDLEEEIEKMRYDLYYIKHRSAWLDVRILFETVGVVLRGPQPSKPAAALSPAAEPTPRPTLPALHLAEEQRMVTVAPIPVAVPTPVTVPDPAAFDTTLDFPTPANLRPRRSSVPGPTRGRQAPIHGDKL